MAQTTLSPLAPPGGFPDLPTIAGVRFAHAQAGVRYKGRTDVMLVECAPGTAVAGVFTRSSTRSAAVLDCQDKIARGGDQGAGAAIIVNSGNSNAFTGYRGREAVEQIQQQVAAHLDCPASAHGSRRLLGSR